MVSEGDRIKLVSTSDPYTDLEPGATGTVTGTNTLEFMSPPERKVLVDWDDGSTLDLVMGEDRYERIDDDE